MAVIDVLKRACKEVYIQTLGFAGTPEGRRTFGRGAGGDLSTRIDLVAEKAVINTIRKSGLNATIIGEECGIIDLGGERKKGQKGFLVMDAVDGTTNATRGIPFYCCSLAFAAGFNIQSVTDAVVVDLVSGDMYYASKGQGAFLNGIRIMVRNSTGKDIVVGMNISAASQKTIERLLPLILKAKHIRHFGANALELCHFARGLMDAYVDFRHKIRVTDMAAAYLIVMEAGGKLYSIDGSELDSDLGFNARMSFLAVPNDRLFRRLAPDLGLA